MLKSSIWKDWVIMFILCFIPEWKQPSRDERKGEDFSTQRTVCQPKGHDINRRMEIDADFIPPKITVTNSSQIRLRGFVVPAVAFDFFGVKSPKWYISSSKLRCSKALGLFFFCGFWRLFGLIRHTSYFIKIVGGKSEKKRFFCEIYFLLSFWMHNIVTFKT